VCRTVCVWHRQVKMAENAQPEHQMLQVHNHDEMLLKLSERHRLLRTQKLWEQRKRREAWLREFKALLHCVDLAEFRDYDPTSLGYIPPKLEMTEIPMFDAEKKEQERADERARIEYENLLFFDKIKNVASRTDSTTSDDATGEARRQASAASQHRRRLEAAAIAKENVEMRRRIRNTKAKEDSDVTDDAAGFARIEAARASRARKQEERARLAAENLAYRQRIANTGAFIDDDITDDVAGAGRRAAARESKARKSSEAAQMRQENAKTKAMLKQTVSWTDNDVRDDATGSARRRLSASKARGPKVRV
jgi:hypothetical protein